MLLVLFNTGQINASPSHRSTHARCYLLLSPNTEPFHVWQFIPSLDAFYPPSITLSGFLAFIYVPFSSISFLKGKINVLPFPAVRNS